MRWIRRPSDPDCAEERIAGGKGSSLARLRALGARVPAFLVIAADAHREMGDGEFTADFLAELRAALAVLGPDTALAVRSSAIGEDDADSSFAGLYHTSLNVTGLEAVCAAIRTCWESHRNVAALQYRAERGRGEDGAAMAVILMEMVQGQWSGVTFTVDPVRQALSRGVINAVPGLGEALVSGEVNPEEIAVAAATGRVLERRTGTHPEQAPDAVVAAAWAAAADIAARLDFPQDVEWAWRDGELFILQSRPITTVADVYYSRKIEPWRDDPEADPDRSDRVWSRMLADETWVSPISPLFYNIHNSTPGRVGFIRSHGDQAWLPPDLFKYHRATAYCDVALLKRMYAFQPRMARIQGIVNFLPPSMQEPFRRAPWRWRGRLRRALSYEVTDRDARSLFHNYKRIEAQWPGYVEIADRWLDLDLDKLSLDELNAHLASVRKEMARVGPPCSIAVLSHAADLHMLLTGLLDRWPHSLGSDGENLYARISSGLDGSETIREAETLWLMAQQLRALGPEAAALARGADWATFRAGVTASAGGPGLVRQFEDFWRSHRHLGSTYKDLIWPRWGDDIDQCFGVLKGYLDSAAIQPSAVHHRSADQRRKAQAEILRSLRGPFAPARRAILKWLFRYNEIYMAVRDNHRYYVDRNWYELRRIYRSFGARLAAAGVLTAKDDVFFLGTGEVEEGLQGRLSAAQAAPRVEVRRLVWETTLRKQGPKFLKGWAPYEEAGASAPEAAGRLRGIAASPGSAVGQARVVHDVRELSSVRDGEILVTRQTDPSWTMVFGRISGLVLETGGVLSHGTSLCREYGLPCVTAVEQATVRIPDGSRIELIGSEGTVRILETT